MSIRESIDNYLNKRDEAAKWADARFTEKANADERARLTKPALEALGDSVGVARRDGRAAVEAYQQAIQSALRDDSDNTRTLTRELAWGRLVRRMERGQSLEAIVASASPVELEALAAFAPAEMPYIAGNEGRTSAEWAAYVQEVVSEAYPQAGSNTSAFASLAEKAATGQAELALADLGAALMDGRELDGQLRNRVYEVDPDLYKRVTA